MYLCKKDFLVSEERRSEKDDERVEKRSFRKEK
jgi:hypothetical protein